MADSAECCQRLATELGITTTVARLLCQRGMADVAEARRFLQPRLSGLTAPDRMADRAVAAERLVRAIQSGERIGIFGDYDCDGITSTAILAEILGRLGAQVLPRLASRFDGGYGLSITAAEQVAGSEVSLLLTCDCGSSDHESIGWLKARGIETIVIDHHLVPDEPLPALAFLNPHRKDCSFGFTALASCGLALSLAAAVRAALKADLDLRQWLDLVAIGTIADVVPLIGDNRALVRAGMRIIDERRRPGLSLLLDKARLEPGRPITSEDLAFRVAPRLNAPGRLGDPGPALDLLMAQDLAEARARVEVVEELQLQRRRLQEKTLKEAVEDLEREQMQDAAAIVVGRSGWSSGIVGIVAGRLAQQYKRPAAVIAFVDGKGRGSVRGPKGALLHDLLSGVADCLLRFGGHQAAAGLDVAEDRFGEFKSRFIASADRTKAHDDQSQGEGPSVELQPEDDALQVARELSLLEPYGQCNPRPKLLLRAEVLEAREVRGGHLRLDLERRGGARIGAFGPGMGNRADSLKGAILVSGSLRESTFLGRNRAELVIESAEPEGQAPDLAGTVTADMLA